MQCIIFDISGPFAHFRKIYSNSSSLSYLTPPRTTIMGIIAAIMGYEKDSYYSKLNSDSCYIGVRIMNEIYSFYQTINYMKIAKPGDIANPKQHTQIPFEVITSKDKVRYRIYVSFKEKSIFSDLENRLIKGKFVYPISMGTAFFLADIDFVDKVELEYIDSSDYHDIFTVIDVDKIEEFEVGSFRQKKIRTEIMPVNFLEDREIQKGKKYIFEKNGLPIKAKIKSNFMYKDLSSDINIIFL